jgi:hypothetical protein
MILLHRRMGRQRLALGPDAVHRAMYGRYVSVCRVRMSSYASRIN